MKPIPLNQISKALDLRAAGNKRADVPLTSMIEHIEMRNLTLAEQEAYSRSIAKLTRPTGVNIFDLKEEGK
ncbi:hypothetical protein [Paenibacillus lutrae]|uniref:Uncharacterized protein n=1 Tax=Paenibacillus lutrae TaxID=2078573 RepID=A0A7X3JZR5_9BACL|nr:hypothetical protein [Paenibacillus lutrae]MVP00368.1 hypothetical protein [Paenibacillus lutrae]